MKQIWNSGNKKSLTVNELLEVQISRSTIRPRRLTTTANRHHDIHNYKCDERNAHLKAQHERLTDRPPHYVRCDVEALTSVDPRRHLYHFQQS